MGHIIIDELIFKINADKKSYNDYQNKEAASNTAEFNRAKKALPNAMKLLPEKQYLYVYLYFVEKKTTIEIAKIYGVNKSTVSRTIDRGLDNLYKIMSIISPEFADGLQRQKQRLRNANTYKRNKKDVILDDSS